MHSFFDGISIQLPGDTAPTPDYHARLLTALLDLYPDIGELGHQGMVIEGFRKQGGKFTLTLRVNNSSKDISEYNVIVIGRLKRTEPISWTPPDYFQVQSLQIVSAQGIADTGKWTELHNHTNRKAAYA